MNWLLFGLFFLFPVASTSLDSAQKKAIIRRFGQCKGSGALPILFHTVVMTRDTKTGDMTLSFKVTVRRQVSQKFSIVLSFWKCDSSGNPDSCEYVLKDYNVTNACRLLTAEDELWSVFLDNFDLPRKCPIKPGTYTLHNTPITTDFLKYMPISDALWKIRMTGWDDGTYLSCIDLEEQVLAWHNKNRSRKY